MVDFSNPFRPGAGHQPPYLAGRKHERDEFIRLNEQDIILENMVLTGLRGVGKTVLLENLKPIAISSKWLWVGTDLSESTSVSEMSLATRVCADMALRTASLVIDSRSLQPLGFTSAETLAHTTLNFQLLMSIYENTAGLALDKLKAVLEFAWLHISNNTSARGIIFAYDEAQNLADRAGNNEYPLSLLLDCFQSLQRKNLPIMLVLTGLPTLFPKLVDARTYSERMFRVVFLHSLSNEESREAILRPISNAKCPVQLSEEAVDRIVKISGGYPYFIQFICKEVYDSFIQKLDDGEPASVPEAEITQKLDTDFFAGRWSRATDRQRVLLSVISQLENADSEFSVQEIVDRSKEVLDSPFSPSHVNQMLVTLGNQGLIFKNRYGRYSFAVPMLGGFISRQMI